MTLNTRIFLGAALGILLGMGFTALGVDHSISKAGLYICGLVSTLFIDLLKMLLVPLIFTSLINGVASLRTHQQINRVWITTLVFFAFTCAIAVVIGLLATRWFAPGKGLDIALFADAMAAQKTVSLGLPEFIQQFLHGLFVNPVTAMAQGNIMAVVVFALLVGIALVKGGDRYPQLHLLFEQLGELIMVLVHGVMHIAPIGIAALLVQLIVKADVVVLERLVVFVSVVIGTTLLHGIVILPGLLFLITRMSPLAFWRGARPALLTAFATSSSSATLPVTLECLDDNFKVNKGISGFVASLGAQVNMDGTALYEAAAALFIAQLCGIDLSIGQQILVCLMAMLAAIGAPGIPSAGMVTMVMVLQSVGLPAEAIAILLPIDRVLDAFRTTVNVEGDLIGSLVVQKLAANQKN
jgi:Na+/H+-dicarboxylate symporter